MLPAQCNSLNPPSSEQPRPAAEDLPEMNDELRGAGRKIFAAMRKRR